ncbi:MAG: thymidylate synthase [bacterium]|nr:thymidylate synthase [bacterium]
MKQYLDLAQEILEHGFDKEGRNGMTRGLFARQLRFDLRNGFPAMTTKQLAFRSVKAELLWFIEGGRKTSWRLDENRLRELLGYPPGKRTIWTEDATSKRWLHRALFPGDCGRIYGVQWRNWKTSGGMPQYIDQLAGAIESIRSDPWDRQHKIVATRNVGELNNDMCFPPCHERFQFFVTPGDDGKPKYLSVHMVQRSCDTFLGVPFNIASYALLLAMVAQVTGLTPFELVIDFVDVHIYEQHFDQVREQLKREPLPPPKLWLNPEVSDIDSFTMEDIKLVDYRHHEPIQAELAKDKIDL